MLKKISSVILFIGITLALTYLLLTGLASEQDYNMACTIRARYNISVQSCTYQDGYYNIIDDNGTRYRYQDGKLTKRGY